MNSQTPTPNEWRAAMGYFPSGVTVVTSWENDTPIGSTVSAFCSVSLEPPLLLVCLDRSNPTRGAVERCGVFGVNILSAESRDIALRFGMIGDADRFRATPYRARPGGAPQLEAAPVFIDCILESAHDAGDHLIMVGRGARIDRIGVAAPLVYHAGGFLEPA